MHRDVAHHAIEGRTDAVVGQLLLLRLAQLHRRLVIRFGVAEGLLSLIVGVAAGHAGLEELALPLDLYRVVIVDGFLLPLGGARRCDGGHLQPRINLHQHLAGFYVIAGVDENLRQVSAHLRQQRCRTA